VLVDNPMYRPVYSAPPTHALYSIPMNGGDDGGVESGECESNGGFGDVPPSNIYVEVQQPGISSGSGRVHGHDFSHDHGQPTQALNIPERSAAGCMRPSPSGGTCMKLAVPGMQFCARHSCPISPCKQGKSSGASTCTAHEAKNIHCEVFGSVTDGEQTHALPEEDCSVFTPDAAATWAAQQADEVVYGDDGSAPTATFDEVDVPSDTTQTYTNLGGTAPNELVGRFVRKRSAYNGFGSAGASDVVV
jgi:hypothetical protein